MILSKVIFLEFASRVGSILVLVGLWNIVQLMIGNESYLRNLVCVCFGLLLWGITQNLEVKTKGFIK